MAGAFGRRKAEDRDGSHRQQAGWIGADRQVR
jgi:hypothetical protein